MEKRKPSHDLETFKSSAMSVETLEITLSALRGARDLGIEKEGMISILQSMERSHFYKSMTSFSDHRVWQDVYHVPWDQETIYVKFTAGRVTEFCLLSFKEK
jgi:motility quorum-sensing regulator / GCU-specific mRNA interferase toxin